MATIPPFRSEYQETKRALSWGPGDIESTQDALSCEIDEQMPIVFMIRPYIAL